MSHTINIQRRNAFKRKTKNMNKYYFLYEMIKENKKKHQSIQKNAFLLTKKAYSFFLLKNQRCFTIKSFFNKKDKITLNRLQINQIVSKMQHHFNDMKKLEKWYFFSKKLVFFYFKNFKKIRGLKKRQPLKGKTQREKYRHRVELMINRDLFVRELFYEKRARRRMRRKSKFFAKAGILYYVATKRNVKATFTTSKQRVLMYSSCGNKKYKKSQRKRLEAKKFLGTKMARFIKRKKYKKIIVIGYEPMARAIRFLRRLYRIRRIRIIMITLKIKKPHNGCRKNKK